ncbi:Telomere-Associated Protein Rif1 [Manis pentadactyla]|nr:Telomere-Associated Protein Rif1 [Manis pentadactyla]
MTDVEVDYVSSETLALRKELGPGSDVTGRATWWIRIMPYVPHIDFRTEKSCRPGLLACTLSVSIDVTDATTLVKINLAFALTSE